MGMQSTAVEVRCPQVMVITFSVFSNRKKKEKKRKTDQIKPMF